MPIGVIINSLSVILGGITGTFFSKKLTSAFKSNLTLVLGVCSMGMGIDSIVLMKYMPAVIFAIVVGTAIGIKLNLGKLINKGAIEMQKPISKFFKDESSNLCEDEFLSALVTIIVLFCASGTGIYGALTAGMTGDNSILISKSILDFFSATIFACNLGPVVSVVAFPQFIIFLFIFLGAKFIVPMTNLAMVADFKACGGFLMLATGFRMINLKKFPIADMLPAMLLVMPLSFIWAKFILPLM